MWHGGKPQPMVSKHYFWFSMSQRIHISSDRWLVIILLVTTCRLRRLRIPLSALWINVLLLCPYFIFLLVHQCINAVLCIVLMSSCPHDPLFLPLHSLGRPLVSPPADDVPPVTCFPLAIQWSLSIHPHLLNCSLVLVALVLVCCFYFLPSLVLQKRQLSPLAGSHMVAGGSLNPPLSIFRLELIHWTVLMLPLCPNEHLIFPKRSQFSWSSLFIEVSDQHSASWVQLCAIDLPVIKSLSSSALLTGFLCGQLVRMIYSSFPLLSIVSGALALYCESKHQVKWEPRIPPKQDKVGCITSGFTACAIISMDHLCQGSFPISLSCLHEVSEHWRAVSC